MSLLQDRYSQINVKKRNQQFEAYSVNFQNSKKCDFSPFGQNLEFVKVIWIATVILTITTYQISYCNNHHQF